MASSTAPSTPENTPQRVALNRSATVPPRLANAHRFSAQPEIGATEGVETLFVCPSASIFQFTVILSSRHSSSPSFGASSQPAGTLPWASSTERSIAAGQIEIYRVPGSVSFLRSGDFLHTIMPRSQCWCVDGVSKFVLPARQFQTYNRIELPSETAEEKELIEAFKITLQRVLHYERTPCPFARTFTVDLPEEKVVKKKRRKAAGPAKRWTLDRAFSWRPEGFEGEERRGSLGSSTADSASESEGESRSATPILGDQNEKDSNEESPAPVEEVQELTLDTPSRPSALATLRSVTAPPQMLLGRDVPKIDTTSEEDGSIKAIEVSTSTENDHRPESSRVFQAIPTDMPPSPPDSSAGIDFNESGPSYELSMVDTLKEHSAVDEATEPEPQPPKHNQIEATPEKNAKAEKPRVSPDSTQSTSTDRKTPPPPTQTTQHAIPENPQETTHHTTDTPHPRPDDPYAQIQARILARRSIGGTTSFLPTTLPPTRRSTSSTSSSAASRRSESSQRQQAFATALVRKACATFLGPPAHLVAIMLRIAARFSSGALGLNLLYVASPPGKARRMPGSFVLDEDDEGEGSEGAEWEGEEDVEEDDFGVPLRSPVRLAAQRRLGADRGGDGRLSDLD
jgi:hypothetical protein